MPRGTGWSTAAPNSPGSASNGRDSDAAFAAATAGWLVILVVAAGALRLLRAFRDAML